MTEITLTIPAIDPLHAALGVYLPGVVLSLFVAFRWLYAPKKRVNRFGSDICLCRDGWSPALCVFASLSWPAFLFGCLTLCLIIFPFWAVFKLARIGRPK